MTLKLDLKTISKTDYDYIDTVFVIDNSESMEYEKFSYVKDACEELIDKLYDQNSSNKMALITFNSTASIEQSLTSDKTLIENAINNIAFSDGTNYYQAFLKIDELLGNYTKNSNRELLVLFVTDGVANEDIPNERPSYEMLKQKYPYINIHMVQYEMGDKINQNIALVSDRQFVSTKDNINAILDKASIVSMTYDTFNIDSYVNTNYFEVLNYNSSLGTLGFDKDVLTWNLDNNIRTFEEALVTVELKLKDEYKDNEVVVPVLTKNVINYKLDNVSETIDSSLSPVISNYNSVSYDMNLPTSCTISNYPEVKKYRVFDNVEIYDKKLVCGDYQLKGFSIKDNTTKFTDSNHFIMPNKSVELVAQWSSLSLSKRMDGKVSKVQTLYNILADNAVMDNIKSESVSSSSGINFHAISSDTNGKGLYLFATTKDDEYPVYYYRGNVKNNNVKFAGFCWKIVRTTETGGIKLVYNGTPDDYGYCTNTTGVDTQIGTSPYEGTKTSAITFGYMYGTLYESVSKHLNLFTLLDMTSHELYNLQNTNYYYSDTVTYENGVYTLVNPTQSLYKEAYRNLGLKYTCLSETEITCTQVKQISTVGLWSTSMSYYSYDNGDTYELLYEENKNNKWVFGNDFQYANGVYKLTTTTDFFIADWSSSGKTATDKKYYTCFSTNDSCSTVYYIIGKVNNSSEVYYIKLTDGKSIDDSKEETFSNVESSTIKNYIDNWYANNMLNYTEYLEDTDWCNERGFSDGSLASKDTSALWSNVSSHSLAYYRIVTTSVRPKLICDRKKDRLNTSVEGFKYPVALLTVDEYLLAGGYRASNSDYYLCTNQKVYTLTPRTYYSTVASNYYIMENGNIDGNGTTYDNKVSYGVRPAIVLKNGIRTDGGNGTMKDPYLITEDVNKNVIG